MAKRRLTRIIYDEEFYIFQAFLLSKKFRKIEEQIRQELKENGTPLPEKGFQSVKEYHNFIEKLHVNEKVLELQEKIENVLEEFGLNRKDELYELGLRWYFLFGFKKPPLRPPYGWSFDLPEDKRSAKITLTIFPWTTKDDVVDDVWSHIKRVQKDLIGYKPRNREWKTFERDFKIYQLFLKVKSNVKRGIKIDPTQDSKSPYSHIFDHPEFKKIKREYGPKSLDDSVGFIISRCRKALHKLNLS